MARPRVLDYMQQYPFWLVDVDPNLNPPFFVFNPTMGFSACSGVGIEMQTEEYHPLHAPYPVTLPGGGRVDPITLTRGARFFDTDFYRWIDRAIRGADDFRRNILLIHMMGANIDAVKEFGLGGEFAGQLLLAGGTSAAVAGAASLLDILPFKENARVPGRAWILWDCLDEQTEILTENGWASYDEVGIGDRVWSLNVQTNQMELAPVDDYVHRSADREEMVAIEGRAMDFRVTGKHGMYVRRRGSGGPLQRITAGELYDMSGEKEIPVSGLAEFPGVPLSDDELRLIAWFVTDGGWKEKVRRQRMLISQSKHYWIEIRDLLDRLQVHYTMRVVKPSRGGFKNGKPMRLFGVPKGTPGGLNGWRDLEPWLKKTIAEGLHVMTRRQFEVFWTELVKGDGSFQKHGGITGSQLYCSMVEQADALMRMAVLRGYAVSCYTRPTKRGHTMYCLTLSDRQYASFRPSRLKAACDPLTRSPAAPGENVWCVSNRNQTIVTRRNGKVAIIGNCVPVRYRAGDFDASSGEVQLMELEIQPRVVTEAALGAII